MNSFLFSERGLESAQRLTSAIYSNNVDSLNDLNDSEIKELQLNFPTKTLVFKPGMTLLDLLLTVGVCRKECKNHANAVDFLW